MRPGSVWPLAPIVVLCVLVGCSSGSENQQGLRSEPALLQGVASVEVLAWDGVPTGEGPIVAQDEYAITVEYGGGPLCGASTTQQEPGAVLAEYADERISITIDPNSQCLADDAVAMLVAFRARIVLSEAIDGRPVTVEVLPIG